MSVLSICRLDLLFTQLCFFLLDKGFCVSLCVCLSVGGFLVTVATALTVNRNILVGYLPLRK